MDNVIYVDNFEDVNQLLKEANSRKKRLETKLRFKCSLCGKETKISLNSFIRKNEFICSVCETKKTNLRRFGVEHPLRIKEIKEKMVQTNLKKYGYKNPAQREDVREKMRKTCKERHGVENPMQSKEIREKARQTNKERYGHECTLQNEQVRENGRQTNLRLRGVEYPAQNEEVMSKMKKTNLKTRGVEYPAQSKEVKEKIRKTNLRNRGVECPFQSEEVKAKIKKTNKERLGVESPAQSKEVREKMKKTCKERLGVENPAQSEEVKLKIKNTNIKRFGCRCSLLSEEVKEKIIKTNVERFGEEHPMRNPEIHKKVFSHRMKENEGFLSKSEKKFADILWVNGLAFESEFFRNGHSFDFKVGDVLVEIDGEYYHGILSDPDGKHVNLAKDHLRFKQAEPFKLLVIDSSRLDAGFKELIRILSMTYEDYENDMISNLPQEFPYPVYPEKMIKNGLKKLKTYDYHKGQNFGRAYQRTIHKELFEPYATAWPNKKNEWVKDRKIYWSPVSSKQLADAFEIDVPNMSEEKFRSFNSTN